jgi:Protein of unknown function (DUF3563)
MTMTEETLVNVSDGSLLSPDFISEMPNFAGRDSRDLTHEDIMAVEREARALRARVLGLMFRRIGRAIERAVWRARQRDVEKYLAKSSDLADLERRMREIEQGRGSSLGGLSY